MPPSGLALRARTLPLEARLFSFSLHLSAGMSSSIVILSEGMSSRSEGIPQSKDPYPPLAATLCLPFSPKRRPITSLLLLLGEADPPLLWGGVELTRSCFGVEQAFMPAFPPTLMSGFSRRGKVRIRPCLQACRTNSLNQLPSHAAAHVERTPLSAAVGVKGTSLCRHRNQDRHQQRRTGVSDPHQRTPAIHPAKRSQTAVCSIWIPTRRGIRWDCVSPEVPV